MHCVLQVTTRNANNGMTGHQRRTARKEVINLEEEQTKQMKVTVWSTVNNTVFKEHLYLESLPRSATVPPLTGVFSLSFFGFTRRGKTPEACVRRNSHIDFKNIQWGRSSRDGYSVRGKVDYSNSIPRNRTHKLNKVKDDDNTVEINKTDTYHRPGELHPNLYVKPQDTKPTVQSTSNQLAM